MKLDISIVTPARQSDERGRQAQLVPGVLQINEHRFFTDRPDNPGSMESMNRIMAELVRLANRP